MEDACLGLSSRYLLRITHVNGIILDQTVFTITKGSPLLGHRWDLNIARSPLKQYLTISSSQFDVTIGSLGIVHPEGDEIAIGLLQTVIAHYFLIVPIDCSLTPSAHDAQLMPLLILIHLLFSSRSRCQGHQCIHPPTGASAKALRLAYLHLTD